MIRRGLGFKLINEGRVLNDFVAFADAAAEPTITTETALLWAKQPKHGCHAYLSQRMRAVGGFAFGLDRQDIDRTHHPRFEVREIARGAAARQRDPVG